MTEPICIYTYIFTLVYIYIYIYTYICTKTRMPLNIKSDIDTITGYFP